VDTKIKREVIKMVQIIGHKYGMPIGIYTDKAGNKANVNSTYVFAPGLSWYIDGEGYFVVDNHDQRRIIPEKYRLK
jgi:hypothetical protein